MRCPAQKEPPEPSEGYDKKSRETPISHEREQETAAWIITGLRDEWLRQPDHDAKNSYLIDLTQTVEGSDFGMRPYFPDVNSQPKQPNDRYLFQFKGALGERAGEQRNLPEAGLAIDKVNYYEALAAAHDVNVIDSQGNLNLAKLINYQDKIQSSNIDRQVIILLREEDYQKELRAVRSRVLNLDDRLIQNTKALTDQLEKAAVAVQDEIGKLKMAKPAPNLTREDVLIQNLTGDKLKEPNEFAKSFERRLDELGTAKRPDRAKTKTPPKPNPTIAQTSAKTTVKAKNLKITKTEPAWPPLSHPDDASGCCRGALDFTTFCKIKT